MKYLPKGFPKLGRAIMNAGEDIMGFGSRTSAERLEDDLYRTLTRLREENRLLREQNQKIRDLCHRCADIIAATPPSSAGWFTIPGGVAGNMLENLRRAAGRRK